MAFPIYFIIYYDSKKAAQYAASLPIQYLFLSILMNYCLSKMQIIIKTNRNSSYLPQGDSDEHSVEQHVYSTVSDLYCMPSGKKKYSQKKVFGYIIIQNYITELYDDYQGRRL